MVYESAWLETVVFFASSTFASLFLNETAMRILKIVLITLVSLIVLGIAGLYISGNKHMLTGIRQTYLIGKNKPDIFDMKYFDVSTIKADHGEPWPMHKRYNLMAMNAEEMAMMDSLQTTAFLVFKNDSLLFEKYWKNTDVETTSNSFSMAKSFTSILIGKAIDEGYIKSVDQKVGDFIPEYSQGKDAELTIKNLLQMTSGIPFGESYNSPFGYMARAYYGKDLPEETFKYHVEREPGTYWIYEGGNTVLLGMILEKATGRTVSDYFFQKVWSCIGAEHDTYWNLDHTGGLEKTYTGVYATARDFARIGKLYMHDGVWDNDTLISPEYVRESLTPCGVPDSTGAPTTWYGYQWWLGEHEGSPLFSARGMRGQYIVVLPKEQLILVRIGHLQVKERKNNMPTDLYQYLDIAKRLTQ